MALLLLGGPLGGLGGSAGGTGGPRMRIQSRGSTTGNIEEYIAKGIHVYRYMRDPQEGTKAEWLKKAFENGARTGSRLCTLSNTGTSWIGEPARPS